MSLTIFIVLAMFYFFFNLKREVLFYLHFSFINIYIFYCSIKQNKNLQDQEPLSLVSNLE